jgi:hypothetical protein
MERLVSDKRLARLAGTGIRMGARAAQLEKRSNAVQFAGIHFLFSTIVCGGYLLLQP